MLLIENIRKIYNFELRWIFGILLEKVTFMDSISKDFSFQDPNVEELALELLEHTCVIGN